MKFTSRALRLEDFSYCYSLIIRNMSVYLREYHLHWRAKNFKEGFKTVWGKVYLLNGRRMGFFSARDKDDVFYLLELQISSRYTGKGYGQKMIQDVERMALKKGYDKIELSVFVDNSAVHFYKRLGFKRIQTKNNEYTMRKLL